MRTEESTRRRLELDAPLGVTCPRIEAKLLGEPSYLCQAHMTNPNPASRPSFPTEPQRGTISHSANYPAIHLRIVEAASTCDFRGRALIGTTVSKKNPRKKPRKNQPPS